MFQSPRFKLVVEHACGRRYFRYRIPEATGRETRIFCECGELLGASRGSFSFRFDADTTLTWGDGLSPRS